MVFLGRLTADVWIPRWRSIGPYRGVVDTVRAAARFKPVETFRAIDDQNELVTASELIRLDPRLAQIDPTPTRVTLAYVGRYAHKLTVGDR